MRDSLPGSGRECFAHQMQIPWAGKGRVVQSNAAVQHPSRTQPGNSLPAITMPWHLSFHRPGLLTDLFSSRFGKIGSYLVLLAGWLVLEITLCVASVLPPSAEGKTETNISDPNRAPSNNLHVLCRKTRGRSKKPSYESFRITVLLLPNTQMSCC